MENRTICSGLVLVFLPLSGSVASQVDGINLLARRAPSPSDVTLDWTGGQPSFHIYRSTSPATVVEPANLLGDSALRTWVDTPPGGSVFFYELTSDCVYAPPEVCDGIDNDCDGVEDGPGSEVSCSLPYATAACVDGACSVAACAAGHGDCDLSAADGCESDFNVEGNCGGCGVTCTDRYCATGSTCVEAACSEGTPRDCSDGEACTDDSCVEESRQCVRFCSTDPCFTTQVGDGAASTPVSDSATHPGAASATYIAKGTTLYAIRNAADGPDPAGSVKWQVPFPATLSGLPSPVLSSDGSGEMIFVAAENGFVYKVRTADGVIDRLADARRPTCPTDRVNATPSVQLYRLSNVDFRSALDAKGLTDHDLVYVVTNADCGSTTENRVIAFDGTSLTKVWEFNADRAYQMDYGSEGCDLDYDRNTLFCGTNLPEGRSQHTVWAIETTSGKLRWSGNVNSIRNRPQLSRQASSPDRRLYVANLNGELMAYDPDGDGAAQMLALWNSPVVLPAGVDRNIWAEFRPPYDDMLFVLDMAGTVRAFHDDGASASLVWTYAPPSGAKAMSLGSVAPTLGKLYVGLNDGTVHQLKMADGSLDNLAVAGSGMVYDPFVDSLGGSTLDRMIVVEGETSGYVKQFCVPFTVSSGN